MTPTPPTESAPAIAEGSVFLSRLRIATYVIILVWLSIVLLEKFRDVLQPFFIALFIGFMMHPVHRWLVRRGIPSMIAYGLILVVVALSVFAFGTLVYANITQVTENLDSYEQRLERRILNVRARLPIETPELEGRFLRKVFASDQLLAATRTALGRFGDFTSLAVLTFFYLLFLIAEKVSFPRRVTLAFGTERGESIMGVFETINQAMGEYVAVKTFASMMAGFFSYVVLALFGVEFAATWGILIFLLNYIPYIGSLIAVTVPIVLSFVQFDEVWKCGAITVALIGVQQLIGNWIEPRMTGQRLDVSPLLILLALAFWGTVWGIIGMILAVPLLVIVKIVLDNIPETKPIATLISNR